MNDAGRELIKRFEGCRLEAYQDTGGVWTIGYGHTGDVEPGQKITQHQADAILNYDIDRHAEGVAKLVSGLTLTENQVAALVSFAFNVGVKRFAGSTLLKLLRAGHVQRAAAQFPRWKFDNGRVLPGLVKRREAERQLFLKE